MNARIFALTAAVVAAAALPAAASAAQIQADRPCYQDDTGTVAVSGNGFEPNQPYQVTLDGQPLPNGTGTTDAAGGIAGSFPTPQLSGNSVHAYTLGIVQGANVPTTGFSVSPFLADFTPGQGNPKTLHVRFKVFGFGLVTANPIVYVHYVRPNGKVKRTLRLGKAQGVCGQIKRTARKKLFPFNAERGKWKLQFDTNKRYRKGMAGSNFLFYTVGVTIKRIFG
ncbi:MAG TPA: hypothetical protein VH247_00180 [Thermoleophilaceae bacterium]|jgi:hypothetical protein|nr:hypothetical protein [Thermoleophilaceae bacterium]